MNLIKFLDKHGKWLWIVFLALVVWLMWNTLVRAQNRDAYAHSILFSDENRVTYREGLRIHNYRSLMKHKFPNGGMVLVTAPNCGPCRLLKNVTLRNRRVVSYINNSRLPYTEAPPSHFKAWVGKQYGEVGAPFIALVDTNAMIRLRTQCPTSEDEFIRKMRRSYVRYGSAVNNKTSYYNSCPCSYACTCGPDCPCRYGGSCGASLSYDNPSSYFSRQTMQQPVLSGNCATGSCGSMTSPSTFLRGPARGGCSSCR